MIQLSSTGDFKKTRAFLARAKKMSKRDILAKYGEKGIAALSAATPRDTGKTAESWYYTITETNKRASIKFFNRNIQNGVPIAIILQYGHVTGSGGYVTGIDYINPALQPVFDALADEVWKEVVRG